jgi:hypothetical protein
MKTSIRPARVSRGVTALVLSAWMLGLPCPALASLGRDVASVQADQVRMRGDVRVLEAAHYAVHEIRVPGGTRIREFVSPSGTVFGIAWQGPFRPDLQQLLGDYFQEFQEAAAAAKSKSRGRGPLGIATPELVVHMGGHLRAFFGRAYDPGLLPPDFAAKDIQ